MDGPNAKDLEAVREVSSEDDEDDDIEKDDGFVCCWFATFHEIRF